MDAISLSDTGIGLRPKPVAIFLAGCFGGIAPTLLRFAIDLVQGRKTISELNASILVGVGLFAILGGGFSLLMKEVDIQKAVVIGMSLPSLITIASSTATAPRTSSPVPLPPMIVQHSIPKGPTPNFFKPVSSSGSRKLRIVLPPNIRYDEAFLYFVCGTNFVPQRRIEAEKDIEVPGCADSFVLETPNALSEKIHIDSQEDLTSVITFKAEKNPWFGFSYAIGLRTQPFDLRVSNVEYEQPPSKPKPVQRE